MCNTIETMHALSRLSELNEQLYKLLHEMNTFQIVNTLENIERQHMLYEVIEDTEKDIEFCEDFLNDSRLIQHFALSQLSRFFLNSPQR
jgi:DNA gyrase/topoisomerase IV subunit B